MWTSRIFLIWTQLWACQGLTLKLDKTIVGGYTTEGLIRTLKPKSLLHCAVECHMETGCIMIGHYSNKQECSLYNTRTPVSLTSDYISDFWTASVCSSSGYTYVASINVCVKVHNSWKSYIEATDECDSEGGATVFVTSTDARFNFMTSHINGPEEKYWVGGQRNQTNPGVWHWVNGDVITGDNGGLFWLPQNPTPSPGPDCINVAFSGNMYGYYNTECDIRNKMFICEAIAHF